jgi:hypothetical protein
MSGRVTFGGARTIISLFSFDAKESWLALLWSGKVRE